MFIKTKPARVLPSNSSSSKTRMLEQRQVSLSSYIKHLQSDQKGSYSKFLNQSATSKTPITCNFVSEVVDRWADNSARLAIRCIDQDNGNSEDITYADLVKRSHRIANFFEIEGLKKGDSVALLLGQRPAWWYSMAGLMRKGIAVVPCPSVLTENDLLYRINDLGIKGIIATTESQGLLASIRNKCPTLKSLLTIRSNGTSLVDFFPDHDIAQSKIDTTTEDTCVYLYTSGTTGQPKAVIHNHDYPFFHAPAAMRWLRATPEDLIYNASDRDGSFTMWITTAALAMGSKLLTTPTTAKFDPQKILAILRDQPVTIFCAAPAVLRSLVAEGNFHSYHFSHLQRIVTVGGALEERVIQQFASRGVEVSVGFGQAETPLLIGRVDDQQHVPGTIGTPIDPSRIVTLDDNLQPLSPGNVGQIAVDLTDGKRNGIMRGYANAPAKTQKAFSPDGRYYLTGDWAEHRRDGFFSYQGRKDDLIKSQGYRIGPDEVEKAGLSHPAVAKIAVVGVPKEHGSLAIIVKAFILLKANQVETPELIKDIQEHIKRETAGHKYPRLVECLSLEEWEKYETNSGKIRRAALREREESKLADEIKLETSELSRMSL